MYFDYTVAKPRRKNGQYVAILRLRACLPISEKISLVCEKTVRLLLKAIFKTLEKNYD